MSKRQSTCATIELSKLESALPLTKSILTNTCPAAPLYQVPVQESQGPQALESKAKAARVPRDWKDPSLARSELLQALVWKNLCVEFTERRLKSREWKWIDFKSSGLPAGKASPLGFPHFPEYQAHRHRQSPREKRVSQMCYTKESEKNLCNQKQTWSTKYLEAGQKMYLFFFFFF